jgi:hypothetical protein
MLLPKCLLPRYVPFLDILNVIFNGWVQVEDAPKAEQPSVRSMSSIHVSLLIYLQILGR